MRGSFIPDKPKLLGSRALSREHLVGFQASGLTCLGCQTDTPGGEDLTPRDRVQAVRPSHAIYLPSNGLPILHLTAGTSLL